MKKQPVTGSQSVKTKTERNAFPVIRVIQRIGSGMLKVFLLVTGMVMISLFFLSVYHYLLTSPYIRLEQVEVKGVDGEIRRELIAICGLNPESSLIGLNLNDLKRKMEKHPWIRSVDLERRFPHTLVVQTEKQIPRALVVMDRFHYMNQWGEIFKEVDESEAMDFPVITGVFKQGSDVEEQLNRAAGILRALESQDSPWSLNELSEIHLEKDAGVSLYFSHLQTEIRLTCEGFARKMAGLRQVTEHLQQTNRIGQVNRIDLDYVNGAVVSFRQT